jgi:hypothetical protein
MAVNPALLQKPAHHARMDPITYSLCHKPVFKLLMFVASACGFPPLLHQAPFALQEADARMVKEFEAPVSKYYSLKLNFHFPTAAAVLADDIVGSRHDASCGRDYASISLAQRMGLGRPIPIHVLVRDKATGVVALDKEFATLCITSQGGGPGFVKTRTAARFPLAAGNYTIELRSLEHQAGLDAVTVTASLVSGDAK